MVISEKIKKNGFTLIEILVAMSIMMIMLAISINMSKSLNDSVELENASKNVDLKIRAAKARSIGALADSNYGVHFDISLNKVVIFDAAGAYVEGAAGNETFALPDKIEIYNIALNGGGADLVFDRLTGNTVNYGSVGLRVTADVSKIKTIFINSNGQSSLSAFGTSAGPALTNARHTHFNLNWDIGSSSQFILKWYDSSNNLILNKPIDTAGHFNAGNTEFSWEDTINESGIDQRITINSWLNASNYTVLDVIRHDTEDDKLEIYFDTERIATYTNNSGVIAITPGSSVVLMEEQ